MSTATAQNGACDANTDIKCWRYIKELNSRSEEALSRTAMTDGRREYSYRQMFRRWDNYAEVFSALDITGKKGGRAGLTGAPAVEPVTAFYALNMTGASVSMIHSVDLRDPERFARIVEKEGITDLVLADYRLNPPLLEQILRARCRLGIRHVIILRTHFYEGFHTRENILKNRENYRRLRTFPGVRFMEDLLVQYEAWPIEYGDAVDNAAVITHTSGTVSGIHKPIPLSDRGLNEAAARLMGDERFHPLLGRAVSCLFMDLSSAYAMADMLHLILAFGGKIVTAPGLPYSPASIRIMESYKVNVLFSSGAFMEQIMRFPAPPDLSGLEFLFLGGSYVSRNSKKRYDSFLEKCGAKIKTSIGYGLSEAGGACLLADPDRQDASMGHPLPGIIIKIYDEEEKKYYDPGEGQRTGVLYLSGPALSSGRIDDRVFFETTSIEGNDFLNTFDLVDVDKDGSLYYLGRLNQYFVNNEGIRFDAGLVEAAVSAQPGIESCCLVPGYDKSIHDTIPVLYVTTVQDSLSEKTGTDNITIVEQALENAFISAGVIRESNLPGQCVIADQIPRNASGKVDIYRIMRGGARGSRFRVAPVRENGQLKAVRLTNVINAPGKRSGLPDELL